MGKALTQKGQTIVPEYVLTFFLVIGALVAMSVFVQRAFQARVRDAKTYMVDTAAAACTQADLDSAAEGRHLDCRGAAGTIAQEYEPYYTNTDSQITRGQNTISGLIVNSIYHKQGIDNTQVSTDSRQAPPGAAN